jgi:hypothetical protein
MPRAILHIGTEKTGSSAIQAYLAGHRDRLRASGFVYSSLPDSKNHVALAAYAQDDTKVDDLRMAFGADNAGRLAGFRTRIEQMLAAEVAANPNATFVFSGEHCHSRLLQPDEVGRLRDLLRRFFDDIRIVVYLRRQDQVAVSLYSTLVKAGGTRAAILDPAALDRRYYDYEALLDRWTEAFGRDRLIVGRFVESMSPQGSIIPDFCARTGIPLLDHAERRLNESLKPPHQEFLRRINERLPRFKGGALNPDRGDIDNYVTAVGSGPGRRPSRAAARKFYESFSASNDAVRVRHFPGSASLFEENFEFYPEVADGAELSIEDTLDITADIWTALVKEGHGLRARAQVLAEPAPREAPAKKMSKPARPRSKAPPPTGGVPRSGGGIVNAGYQRDDNNIVDYQLWQMGDQKLRGPEPDFTKPYFAAIGAAQVFGRFGAKPFPALLAERIGMQALNLGMSGAGPSFFLQRDELIEAANRAQFVIVQLMSGRSVSNSRAVLANNQGVMWPRADPEGPALFAEDIYRDFVQTLSAAELAELRAESREIYVAETQALLERIERPKILLYWSKRPVDYDDGLGDLASYWGDFPHFVNRDVIDMLAPFADHYVEVVGNRGLPQPLFHRETGAPVLMWPEERFPNVHLREHNHYYPSPEMNADAAEALMPAAQRAAAAPPPPIAIKPRPGLRHVLVHMHIFKNGGAAIDRALKEGFDHRWTAVASPAPEKGAEAVAQATDADPRLLAVSASQIRFPFARRDGLRFHPLLFLRNPILRARAVYQHERSEWQRDNSDGLHTRMANQHDFRAWIQWCLSERMLSGPIANYQTRMCSISDNGTKLDDWARPITLRHFREASTLLANATVGTIEDFDASLIRIERILHATFPKLRLLSYLDDVSVPDGIYPDLGMDDVRDELGEKVHSQLCAANAFDLLLWRRARTSAEP